MGENTISLPQSKAAKALGITDRTLRNWEKAGLIEGHRPRPGGVKLYAIDKLRALVGIRKEDDGGNAQ